MKSNNSFDEKMKQWEKVEDELAPILLQFITEKNVPPLVISGAYKKIATGAWKRWFTSQSAS